MSLIQMRKQTKHWKTKNGEKIRICDMEDSHLLNAYRMCSRNWQGHLQAAESAGWNMLACLQGEMAIESVERELMALEYADMHEDWPITDNLYLEILRRNLEGEL